MDHSSTSPQRESNFPFILCNKILEQMWRFKISQFYTTDWRVHFAFRMTRLCSCHLTLIIQSRASLLFMVPLLIVCTPPCSILRMNPIYSNSSTKAALLISKSNIFLSSIALYFKEKVESTPMPFSSLSNPFPLNKQSSILSYRNSVYFFHI